MPPARKYWMCAGVTGGWPVYGDEWEKLWKSADWETRFINSPERAQREWDKLNEQES